VADATRARVRMAPEGEEKYGGRAGPVEVALYVVVAGPNGEAFLPTTGSPGTWGHGGAPCEIGFVDPNLDVSFAFLTNGYPPSGYDYSRSGRNRITNIANLAADLVA
jgi:CubicO group peptidase (beta-lactamase class C family)